MGKRLYSFQQIMIAIIAEKPSVGMDIARVIGASEKHDGYISGNGYMVIWALGHLVSLALPGFYGVARPAAEELPIIPEPFHLTIRHRKTPKGMQPDKVASKQLDIIDQVFNQCESIIVATDAGREGELIFRYIYTYLGYTKPFRRLWISSLTDEAIQKGMENLKEGQEYDNLYFAADCRAKADWLLGMNASQALAIASGMGNNSLGRVQTPTLALICSRFRENRDFISTPYWQIHITLEKDGNFRQFRYTEELKTKSEAEELFTRIKEFPFATVISSLRKQVFQSQPLLYDLTALQKDCNIHYDFPADKTLDIAQSLYEKKLISYPRTGSRYISEDVFREIPSLLRMCLRMQPFRHFTKEMDVYKPARKSVNDKKITDHHALIITGNYPQELSHQEAKVYHLIAGRMLEAFGPKCEKESLDREAVIDDMVFRSVSNRIINPGWRNVFRRSEDKEPNEKDSDEGTALFEQGENVKVGGHSLAQKKTMPKPLYTEATLLTAMETASKNISDEKMREAMKDQGLGTPATRASILTTLFKREYIERSGKSLVPTEKGLFIYEAVKNLLISDVELTGNWEKTLSDIQNGDVSPEVFMGAIERYTRQVTDEVLSLTFPKSANHSIPCPKCKEGNIMIRQKLAKCDNEGCGLMVFRKFLNKELTDQHMQQLFSSGKTKLIKGFKGKKGNVSKRNFDAVFQIAKKTKFISEDFDITIAQKLYPLDIISAYVLTQAIQRYGQNERSLFSFLTSKDLNSISNFKPTETETYNLSNVYNYIVYNFYSYLSEANTDSANWRAIRVALERVEGLFDIDNVEDASKIVKTVGLYNLFGGSTIFNEEALFNYAKLALDINQPSELIKELVSLKIIRFAKYKSQYIIFEGTDVNIEDELYKAAGQISPPIDFVEDLRTYFEFKIIQANASYYKTGTPRFFEYRLSNQALILTPEKDIDGYINLVFSNNSNEREHLIEISENCENAVLYVYFRNTDVIVNHLYEIQKLEYIKKHVLVEDKIAEKEILNLITYEKESLNQAINQSLMSFSDNIEWYYKGKKVFMASQADFNKLLSKICDEVYYFTPIVHSELFNKQKVNSAVSLARVTLLNKLIDDNCVILDDLGFDKEKFPPEKTIYYALVKNTGIHCDKNGYFSLGEPQIDSLRHLWAECEVFMKSSVEKQRKLGDLIKTLESAPFKLKQGFLDFWIPIYLIIKKQDYSLYDSEDRYIPHPNKQVLELLQKSPNKFKIKAFAFDGVKVEFFNQYRALINQDNKDLIKSDSFLETIRPFLAFYNSLNEFAKTTQNFDNPKTIQFRNVLAKAKDPEKTFFEDLPAAFGFKNNSLSANKEFMTQYQGLIKAVIRELRSCYSNLIKRLEDNMIEVLRLQSNEYAEYRLEIENRFRNVKVNLLSSKQKSFYNRLLMPQSDKTLWYESICYVILDKPLVSIKDNEIDLLTDSLKYLLSTLTKFIDIL